MVGLVWVVLGFSLCILWVVLLINGNIMLNGRLYFLSNLVVRVYMWLVKLYVNMVVKWRFLCCFELVLYIWLDSVEVMVFRNVVFFVEEVFMKKGIFLKFIFCCLLKVCMG